MLHTIVAAILALMGLVDVLLPEDIDGHSAYDEYRFQREPYLDGRGQRG